MRSIFCSAPKMDLWEKTDRPTSESSLNSCCLSLLYLLQTNIIWCTVSKFPHSHRPSGCFPTTFRHPARPQWPYLILVKITLSLRPALVFHILSLTKGCKAKKYLPLFSIVYSSCHWCSSFSLHLLWHSLFPRGTFNSTVSFDKASFAKKLEILFPSTPEWPGIHRKTYIESWSFNSE